MSNVRRRQQRSLQSDRGRYASFDRDDHSVERMVGERVTVRADGCWIMDGKPDTYASTSLGGSAHRFVYETLVGPVPDGHHLHHECQHPGCVNPAHLIPLTPREHSARHRELDANAA